MPEGEKDFEKIRLFAKKKGKIIRQLEINKEKSETIHEWHEYLTEISDITQNDPAFIYLMMKPLLDSSGETVTNPPMALNAEALALVYEKVQETGGKQDFNLLKGYKQYWRQVQQQGEVRQPSRGKADGWVNIPSKVNDPEHFEKNVSKLMGYASGWCTAFFGKSLLAIEPSCVGKGVKVCEWLIKPIEEFDKEHDKYINSLKTFWNK